ncbi:MAG: OmpH family outer membrane protein [Sphingobium sp.]
MAAAGTAVAMTALAAVPAQAQVAGVATANATVAIARAKALIPAYQQIETTYASYMTQIQGKRKEMNDLLAKLDTNGDKNVDQAEMDKAEAAKNPVLTQVEAKEKEIGNLQAPIVKAQIFVVSQIVDKYPAAQQAVVTAKKLNYILSPDAFAWAPPSIDVTEAITAELDKVLPTANTSPATDWKPDQQTFQVYQQVQQLLSQAAQVQAARAAQQQAPAAGQQPAGR